LAKFFQSGNKIREGKAAMQRAAGTTGDIEDGALRVCLNLPFVGIYPSAPRVTLALSLAMIRGLARGVQRDLEPYLKAKSAQLHHDGLVKSLAKGQLGKAQKLVAREMFLWQNLRVSENPEYTSKLQLAVPEPCSQPECADGNAKEARRFHASVYKNVMQQQTDACAKDRHGVNNPDFAKQRREHHAAKWFSDERSADVTPIDTARQAALGGQWDLMTLAQQKPWLAGAEKQLKAHAAEWAWALPEATANSAVVQSTSTKRSFMDSFATFVGHQLPYLIAKILSDKLGSLANALASVLGEPEDDAPSKKPEAEQPAAVALLDLGKPKTSTGAIRHPRDNDKLHLGEHAELVFDTADLEQDVPHACTDKLEIELRADSMLGSKLYGRWELRHIDLEDSTVPPEGLHKDPNNSLDDGDRDKICGASGDTCKVVRIKIEKPAKINNPDNRDISGGKGYFFRIKCGDKLVTKGEPRFQIVPAVKPERNPCRETLMLTLGLFPFKWPLGVDADMIKCGASAISKIKNKISAMKRKKKQEQETTQLDEQAAVVPTTGAEAADHDADMVEHDLEDGTAEQETQEEAESANQLETAQGNSEYGIGTASDTAQSSPSCSRLKVYGGVGINLGAIELLLTGLKGWYKAIKAVVALAAAHMKASDTALETAWLPTKRELEREIVESGAVDTLDDPLLSKFLKPIDDISDPDQKLTRVQLSTLKSTDTTLALIIQEKQEEVRVGSCCET
jgi:hypothetical protein